MAGWSSERLLSYLQSELVNLGEFGKKVESETENSLQQNLEFLRDIVSQVPDPDSGSLLLKTPKVTRKYRLKRIETIHEDESAEFEDTKTTSIVSEPDEIKVEENDDDDNLSNRRSRRTASKKAACSIKQQQSTTLNAKLRRPSETDNKEKIQKRMVKTETKEQSSSSEEEVVKPVRQSKTRKTSILKKKSSQGAVSLLQIPTNDNTYIMEAESRRGTLVESNERESTSKRKHDETGSPSPSPQPTKQTRSSRTRSGEPAAKKPNLRVDCLEKSNLEDTLESSIYEDAIGKPAPIHNSTKIGDTTVTLEPKARESTKKSDPELKEYANNIKPTNNMNVTVTLDALPKFRKQAAIEEDDDTLEHEDIVDCTPEVKNLTKNSMHMGFKAKALQAAKNNHKLNALFSPYATDSVKKRVEAFEQVGLSSPKAVEVDAPTRLTRTKTRAMAAAAASVNSVQPAQPAQSISQKLARRSLAKAKKISLAKRVRDMDDVKENDDITGSTVKPNRLLANNEKLMQKLQLRITPISKSRLQQPMSVNRVQQTPVSIQPLSSQSKAMSASRTNIIMSMDSFIPSKKETVKLSMTEKLEEKKRRANEEDARKKKVEALKAHAEEKKRKREEKEKKNRLAREARDKLEMEKRMKAEKEREEKARIALQIQEKQREENEKKRQHQLQRAQEKEERRRQEEQLRLQRLQEQEETERQYAEQRRKEQEAAEKQHQRRIAEAKAQQQALAEAAKIKVQYQNTKTTKILNSTHTLPNPMPAPPTSYHIESEPDEDDTSDNEDAPKHAVPLWATAAARRKPLELQTYIKSYEVHRYFDSRQCTPDLTKIFKNIDKRRLKRTSSAIWKTPPRYSMMYNE